MKLFEALLLLAVVCLASAGVADIHPLSAKRIFLINQKANTWIAGKNFDISEWERVKKLSSGVLGKSPKHELYTSNPHDESEDVPESFDAREAWPKCDSIRQIRDQSNCGSCWAFGAVEAMSDRICIHSNQKKQVYVSAEELTSCCSDCGDGCDGGYISRGFNYWKTSGIVTGGLYNSSQGCQDYSLEPCEHHVDDGPRPQCASLIYTTPACSYTCYDKKLNFEKSKTYGQHVISFDNEKQMKLEIFKNGPVEAYLDVYDDFPTYKSGVYQRTSNKTIGGHAIKMLGWGVENDTPYWLCANSWNSDWGDKGYFKILRGSNHCKIEEDVVASLPKL